MLNQHHAQRFQPGTRSHIGTVPVGTIVYLQDRIDRYNPPIFRNPWIVTAWHNREYFPVVKGRPEVLYMAGGHLATVRSLRDGRELRVSAHHILNAVDNGWQKN